MIGTNRIGGTAGWTRESLSSRSESNIRGEALSTSVRESPFSSSAFWLAIATAEFSFQRTSDRGVYPRGCDAAGDDGQATQASVVDDPPRSEPQAVDLSLPPVRQPVAVA